MFIAEMFSGRQPSAEPKAAELAPVPANMSAADASVLTATAAVADPLPMSSAASPECTSSSFTQLQHAPRARRLSTRPMNMADLRNDESFTSSWAPRPRVSLEIREEDGDVFAGERLEVFVPNGARRRRSVSGTIKKSMVSGEKADTLSPEQCRLRLATLNTPPSAGELAAERDERRFVIDPEARWYLAWVATVSALAAYSSSVVAYQLAFFDSFRGLDGLLVIEWLIDAVFVVDMLMTFFVGFFEADVKVMVRSLCRRHYAWTLRCALDATAALPLDLIQMGVGWTPFSRANKLVRLYSLAHHMKVLQGVSHQPAIINAFMIVRLVLIWLLFPHLFACLRILLMRYTEFDGEQGRWKEIQLQGTSQANPIVDETDWVRYLHALYWCLGLMTGFGDGNIPENSLQHAYTLALINLGLFTFAYTVGVLGAIGAAGSQRANDFQVLMHAIARFTERYGIQDALLERITRYLRHRWEQITANNRELVDAKELLEQLPRTMRYEAVESMTRDTLARVPLFARVEEGFIHALTQKMQAVNCSIGETLVREGEMNETFYIVLNGSLEVTMGTRHMATLNSGSFFGERTLLSKQAARATVTSTSFCELYSLARSDLQMLRINFPDTFTGFAQAAKLEAKNADRANRVKSLAAHRAESQMAWVVKPESRARAAWSACLYVALAYDVYTLPFKLVFVGNSLDPLLTALDVVCDLWLLADTFGQFALAFTIDGRLILDPKHIRQRYLRGTSEARFVRQGGRIMQGGRDHSWRALLGGAFLYNLLGSLPWVVVTAAWPAVDARVLQALRFFRLLRLMPWLRADKVDKQQPSGLDELIRLSQRSAFDLHYTAKRLLPLLAAYTVLAHYVACGYFAVVLSVVPPHESDYGVLWLPAANVHDRFAVFGTSPHGENRTSGLMRPFQNTSRVDALLNESEWLPTRAYLQYGTMMLYYLRALYYSVCNLTGLGKSPAPLFAASVQYTIVTFVCGVLVFAYITSSIVTLVMNANAPLANYRAKKNALLGYLSDASVPPAILSRANGWLEHWWYAHGGTPAGFVIDQLPPSLRQEVRFRIFQKVTQSSRVFLPLWDHLKKKPGQKGRSSVIKAKSVTAASLVNEQSFTHKRKGASNGDSEGTAKASAVLAAANCRVSAVHPDVLNVEEKTDNAREMMIRELIHAMTFEVYNPGEWVLHKGMLNEWLYVVAVGTAEVLLAEPEVANDTYAEIATKQFPHLTGKVVQELGTGDVFGEISAMYRNKCEASVRAKTPLEVIAIPRTTMMKTLHRSPALMERILELVRRRRKENEIFKLSSGERATEAASLRASLLARIAAHKLAAHVRKRLKLRRAKEAEDAEQLSAGGAHADFSELYC